MLVARVSGGIDAQSVRMAYWREIFENARIRHCRKLLVIDRKKGTPASPEELASLAHAFVVEREYVDRIAVVEPTAEFVTSLQHGEIHARSLGINLRIFAESRSAIRWLRFGSADD